MSEKEDLYKAIERDATGSQFERVRDLLDAYAEQDNADLGLFRVLDSFLSLFAMMYSAASKPVMITENMLGMVEAAIEKKKGGPKLGPPTRPPAGEGAYL